MLLRPRLDITYCAFFLCTLTVATLALPSSLVDEIKATELRDNKVKRAHPELNLEQHYYSKPAAIKRGAINLKTSPQDQLADWEQEQQDNFGQVQSTLFNSNPFDDKTVQEYEKGFRYGTNKDKLDEAIENAVLKSELYGEPAAINQYRYFSGDERRRRRRRDAKRPRLTNRIKRDVELTPEEILTILTLYENERNNYRPWGPADSDQDPDDDESWMDAPVYPHATTTHSDLGPGYLLDNADKRSRWNKRFMVAKKRNDPTRELRYLNGPTKNDYYTLSQLLSNQREPNVPLYHRLVL